MTQQMSTEEYLALTAERQITRLERANATLRKPLAELVAIDDERGLADEAVEVPDTWTLPLSVSGTASERLHTVLAAARAALEATDGNAT